MEQKHYRYEGEAKIHTGDKSPENVEVKAVEFFVPVRVHMVVDDADVYESAHLDYANKQIFFNDVRFNTDQVKAEVFSYLFNVTNPPNNQYEAGDEIYEQVDRAREEYDQVNKTKEGSPCQTE